MPVPVGNHTLIVGGTAALVLVAAGVYWQQSRRLKNGTVTGRTSKAASRQGMSQSQQHTAQARGDTQR